MNGFICSMTGSSALTEKEGILRLIAEEYLMKLKSFVQ